MADPISRLAPHTDCDDSLTMSPIDLLRAFTVLALASLSAPTSAQEHGSSSHRGASATTPFFEAVDSTYYAGRPAEAWDALQAYLEGDPDDYDALWRACRSALVIAVSVDRNREQNGWLDSGRELAERAVARRPDGIEGLYFQAALTGRRAMNANPRYAVELAQLAYDDAHRILAIDSLHGGAHNVLGKLNYEVMSLSRIERFLARLLMGNAAIRDTGWDQAEHHLERAATLWPELVLFEYDLAALHEKRGRDDEARAALERALGLPVLHPPDTRFKERAQALLDEINR